MKNLLKKSLTIFLFMALMFFSESVSPAQANKYVGINIGDHYNEADSAAEIVGPGGWIVVMACPSNAPDLQEMFVKHSETNFVLRGHYPTYLPDEDMAKEWTATLANIQTGGQKIFFVPWNDPNNMMGPGASTGCSVYPGVGDGWHAPDVAQYSLWLKSYFNEVGLGSKVDLLTPAFNFSNGLCSFENYVAGMPANFINQFAGLAINYYDFQSGFGPIGNPDWHLNPIRFQEALDNIDFNGPIFLQETGVVLDGPRYTDHLFQTFYNAAFGHGAWDSSRFMMEAIFSYDPEHEEHWDIYNSVTAGLIKSQGESQGSGTLYAGSGGDQLASFISNYDLTLCDNGVSYFLGDDSTACIPCAAMYGDAQNNLELPPNRRTEYGSPVYGRNIPCGPLVISQGPWIDQNQGNYYLPYNINSPLDSSTGGYPFDYSPWRPYPGDSGRAFYNLNGRIINNPNDKNDRRTCYDLTRQPLTSYCNPAPKITDIVKWFPLDAGDYHIFNEHLGQFRAWYTDSIQNQASQIPFLGNSLTSSREFRDASQRASLFVTDFLRGSVYWDRKPIDLDDSIDQARIKNESGPIRKLMPKERINTWDYRNAFLQCRLFGLGNCGYPLLHKDNIHDYVLTYSHHSKIIEEGKFTALPDRREIKNHEGPPYPYRLSVYYCRIIKNNLPLRLLLGCPEGDYGFEEGLAWMNLTENLPYFPLTSREDVPSIVDTSFTAVWRVDHGEEEGGSTGETPLGKPFTSEPTIEEIYTVIEGEWVTDLTAFPPIPVWTEYGGIYYIDRGEISELNPNLHEYEFHFVDLVSIPYIAETRELGEWAGLALTPHKMDWQQSQEVDQLRLGGSCNIPEIVRGGPGDTLAGDWRHQLEAAWAPEEGKRLLRLFNEGEDQVGAGDWGCKTVPPANPWDFPDRVTARITNKTGRITTKIPFLNEIAKRLIGDGGIFKTLMPQSFNELVLETIADITQGKVYPWELPGYGPAHFTYLNDLENQNVVKHWGCCPPVWAVCAAGQPCEQCVGGYESLCSCPVGCKCVGPTCYEKYSLGNCLRAQDDQGDWHNLPCNCGSCFKENCGPTRDTLDRDYRGLADVNDEEAAFYYPYIGAIDIFRQYLLNAVNPYALANFGTGLTTAGTSSTGSSGTGYCDVATSGPCAVDNLKKYFGDEDQAINASQICLRESGGDPTIANKGCLTNTTLDYSLGLFQINMLAHPAPVPSGLATKLSQAGHDGESCYSAFTYSGLSCQIKSGYNDVVSICEDWFLDPVHNIEYAQTLYNRSGWSPWAAAAVCGIK